SWDDRSSASGFAMTSTSVLRITGSSCTSRRGVRYGAWPNGSGGALMGSQSIETARQGFEAWQQGDFDTIEAMLDPEVQWRSFEPGDWECKSREDVMRTLGERHAQGFG